MKIRIIKLLQYLLAVPVAIIILLLALLLVPFIILIKPEAVKIFDFTNQTEEETERIIEKHKEALIKLGKEE